MKTLGKAGNNILVEMDKYELAAITGFHTQDEKIKQADNGGQIVLDVQSPVKKILEVSEVPKELRNLKVQLSRVLKTIEIAEAAAGNVAALAGK